MVDSTALPPHSIDAEQAVLASCLIERATIATLEPLLTPTDFYIHAHNIIYTALLNLWKRKVPSDIITLIVALEHMKPVAGINALAYVGDASYISELLLATPTATHALYYAEIVKAHSVRRSTITAGQQIIADGYDNTLTQEERAHRAAEAVRRLPSQDRGSVSINELITAWQKEPEGVRNPGIMTGISAYDQMTRGLRPGQLVVIGARTGIGKSALAIQWAHHIASAGHPVSFLSLEMSNRQILMRLVSQETDVNMSRAEAEEQYYYANLSKIMDAQEQLATLPFHMKDRLSGDLASITSTITKHRTDHRINVAVIDYLGLMDNTAARAANRAIELGTITRALKLLAQEQDITIILPAQLNRELENLGVDASPRLADLRDSGSIEQDADVVLLLHRSQPEAVQTTFYVAKNREGNTGKAQMKFIRFRTRFESMGTEL